MDVNGTRFHLVLQESEWLATDSLPAAGVEFRDGALQLQAELPLFPPRRTELPPDPAERRGAGRDRYGNWYWIADGRDEIRTLPTGRTAGVHFWAPGDMRPPAPAPAGGFAAAGATAGTALELAGLAVTRDHYLVVGRLDPGGLLVFDLHGGGAPVELHWPAAVPFAPFDLIAADDGGIWVLDRDHLLLWRLDRWLRVVSPGPVPPPVSGSFVPAPPAPPHGHKHASAPPPPPVAPFTCDVRQVTPAAGRSLRALASPSALAALPDGSVLVLDDAPAGPASVVARYGPHHEGPSTIALDAGLPGASLVAGEGAEHPLPLRGYDMAAVATADARDRVSGSLYMVRPDGNQALVFDLTAADTAFALALRPDYLPMRRFSGKALVTADAQPYYDSGDRWLPLVQQPNPRYAMSGTAPLPAGWIAFDGGEPQCVWHRLLFDGCVPPGGGVVVSCRAADAPELLAALPWRPQPAPYLRGNGAELPYYEPPVGDSDRDGTYELLFQDVVGRYLQLQVTLTGNGRVSPRLRALRIYYPRFSYLREYLPAVYRDDPVSASFLDRYLANVEGMFTTLEGRIAQAQVLMDVRTVPARFLDWLAAWFGITLDAGWSDATRRLFLAHAPQYFRERGTCAGMVRALRLALSSCIDAALFDDAPCAANAPGFGIRIIEGFRTRRRSSLQLGDPSDLLGPGLVTGPFAWTPAQGAEPLHQRWRAYLEARYGTREALAAAWHSDAPAFEDPALRFPAVRPTDCRRTDWLRFVQRELDFVYAVVTDADEPLYREFLAHRYPQPKDVNQAYGLAGAQALTSFADATQNLWQGVLQQTLPSGGPWLRDWLVFATQILPLDHGANRFTVLVPVGLSDTLDDQQRRQAIADRVARLEKPAHTDVEVRLYWGIFRAGEARLGQDTVLGPGSRTVAIVLGGALVGAGHLGFPDPARAPDRVTFADELLPAPATAACCSGT